MTEPTGVEETAGVVAIDLDPAADPAPAPGLGDGPDTRPGEGGDGPDARQGEGGGGPDARQGDGGGGPDARQGEGGDLARVVEALLFLSNEPVPVADLAEAANAAPEDVGAALEELRAAYAPGRRGLLLRELAGGFTLSTDPAAEAAARRLLAKPRIPPLTPAQAEVLAIVAYLQPVSRPEMARIRGVSSDSATATLLERGLIEEAGRSQFGAVLYRTTELFLKLFGLRSVDELPDVARWDPTPEETAALRERLLRAGDARSGNAPVAGGSPGDDAPAGDAPAEDAPADDAAVGESGPSGELTAGGVDVAPPGEPDGGAQAVPLERGSERGDGLAS